MKKILLIIGRFQPFHLGHLHIIKKYSQKGFFIKIVIGSTQKSHEKKNPFTKDEREDMILLSLKANKIKNYKIYNVPDHNDDEKWIKGLRKSVGDFDSLYTGNKLVKELFGLYLTDVHVLKEGRRFRDLSATEIRKKWLDIKGKKGLPEEVFNYLKKIRAFDRLHEMHDSKKKVHYLLRLEGLTISVAESCTGGAISKALISNIPFVIYKIYSNYESSYTSKFASI